MASKTLLEGGNVEIGGKFADRIDIRKIPLKEVQKSFGHFAKLLNEAFAKKHGRALWDNTMLKTQKIYSGSALHLMTHKTPDFLLLHKPTFGDVDLQVDETLKEEVTSWLHNLHGTFGDGTYLGCKPIIEQVITLWEFNIKGNKLNIQVDFEFVPYHGSEPSAWAQFSHSSSMADLEAGVKGVFHKHLLRAFTAKNFEEGMLAKGRAGKEKFEKTDIKLWAFSVAKGLRKKYVETGNTMDGLKVYKTNRSTEKDQYTQDLNDIIHVLLRIEKPTKQDFKDFESFIGCMKLLKKSNLSPNEVQNVVVAFVDLLWGKGAQSLYRDDLKKDFEEKMVAFKALEKETGVTLPKVTIDKLAADFYELQKSKQK